MQHQRKATIRVEDYRSSLMFGRGLVVAVCVGLAVVVVVGACRQQTPSSLADVSPKGRPAGTGEGLVIATQVPVSGADSRCRIVTVGEQDRAIISVLTEGFAVAASPDLSFDGERFLFVGSRGEEDPQSIWEMRIDGSGLRLVTTCPGGCAEAIYLSTIYTIDMLAPVDQIAFVTLSSVEIPSEIFTCRLDGSRARRITFTANGASDPFLLDDGRLLFTMQVSPSNDETGNTDCLEAALFTVNTDGTDVFPFLGLHRRSGARPHTIQVDDPDWRTLNAKRIASRDRPPGRASVVDRDDAPAQLYCLNAYMTGLRGRSENDKTINKVRFYSRGGSSEVQSRTMPRLLGEAPVESDGSFFVELPSGIPIQLETIGSNGQSINRMRSYFWVMPGERRGCIGCHEDRALTPPNRHVFALRRPPTRITSDCLDPEKRKSPQTPGGRP